MKIEKVTRFIRGVSSEPNIMGPRLVRVSLPRVRWIEGDPSAHRYYRDEEINEESISEELGITKDKVHNFFYRKGV